MNLAENLVGAVHCFYLSEVLDSVTERGSCIEERLGFAGNSGFEPGEFVGSYNFEPGAEFWLLGAIFDCLALDLTLGGYWYS